MYVDARENVMAWDTTRAMPAALPRVQLACLVRMKNTYTQTTGGPRRARVRSARMSGARRMVSPRHASLSPIFSTSPAHTSWTKNQVGQPHGDLWEQDDQDQGDHLDNHERHHAAV